MNDKDIHKWTDGRYTLMFDEHTFFVWDNEKEERMTALNVTKKLNEQQSTIDKQDKEIAELDQQCADFLGDKIKALEEFEECTDKLKEKIVEQQATIEMYQRRVDKREEQISIIKKHCLKFLTDEQFETIRKELEDEIGRV